MGVIEELLSVGIRRGEGIFAQCLILTKQFKELEQNVRYEIKPSG